MSLTPIYIGIDVACAKQKRLPICVVQVNNRISPIKLPADLIRLIPKGPGNREIEIDRPFAGHAAEVAAALRQIAQSQKWRIERIAIDAPALAPLHSPRSSEEDMTKKGLSSFRTPEVERWPEIAQCCRIHLSEGKSLASLPYANMIWMLYGFELYKNLRATFDCEVIETYPAGIAREIAPGAKHKSNKEEGYKPQLSAIAACTQWEPSILEKELRGAVSGAGHDRLDAFMAAWVASLPVDKRRAYGAETNPDDSIWVPRV